MLWLIRRCLRLYRNEVHTVETVCEANLKRRLHRASATPTRPVTSISDAAPTDVYIYWNYFLHQVTIPATGSLIAARSKFAALEHFHLVSRRASIPPHCVPDCYTIPWTTDDDPLKDACNDGLSDYVCCYSVALNMLLLITPRCAVSPRHAYCRSITAYSGPCSRQGMEKAE